MSKVSLGDIELKKLALGDLAIKKVSLGDVAVWSAWTPGSYGLASNFTTTRSSYVNVPVVAVADAEPASASGDIVIPAGNYSFRVTATASYFRNDLRFGIRVAGQADSLFPTLPSSSGTIDQTITVSIPTDSIMSLIVICSAASARVIPTSGFSFTITPA